MQEAQLNRLKEVLSQWEALEKRLTEQMEQRAKNENYIAAGYDQCQLEFLRERIVELKTILYAA